MIEQMSTELMCWEPGFSHGGRESKVSCRKTLRYRI